MDTKKLRQKILDLAIHGKLVPQDPNDEPASVLLERIRAEKERLISEGKIKRSRKTVKTADTHHYEQDVPFEVPKGGTTLGEICTFLSRGKSPKYSEERKFPVFAQKCNLKEGGISLKLARFLDPSTIDKWEESYKLKTGDILINSTGTGTVGRTRLFDESFLGAYPFVVPDSHVSVVRTSTKIVSEYVYAYVSSLSTQLYLEENLAGSTNQKELYIGVIERLPLPLPPLAEQQRIVSEIERWSVLIDTIEQGKENLEISIKQAKGKILDLAIHGKLVPQDPSDEPASELLKRINPKAQITCDNEHSRKLPKGWCNTTLANMCNTTNGLWKGKKPPFVKVGVIRNANFTKYFTLDYSKIEYIDVEQRAFEKKHLLHGDLIVEKSGGSDKNPVGRAIFFDGEDGLFSFSNFTMCLRCKDQTTLMSKYLFYLLLCIYSRGDMVAMQTQTTGLHNLLVEKFMAMTFPLPPFAEQKRIVQKIEELFSLLDCIEKALQA